MLSVRFWGVRGTIACPGDSTVQFGGNTACIEIRADDRLVIVDMGTGLFGLGQHLLNKDEKRGSIDADIFLSHTHLDHISGFQMFTPILFKTTKLRFYAPRLSDGRGLRDVINDFMSYHYWPIRLCEIPAELTFKDIGETTIDLGEGLVVTSKYLNHPVVCIGYRFMYKGKTIVTAFDNEGYWNVFGDEPSDDFFIEDALRTSEKVICAENKKLIEFYNNADVLIYDAAYIEEEYIKGKQHWGHSTVESAIKMAEEADVKKLVLFHHEPLRRDAELHKLENDYKTKNKPLSGLEILISREGMVIEA